MGKIKLICCDIDGTLLRSDKSLSEENIACIRKVSNEKKIPFVIVSGRIYPSVRSFYSILGIEGPSSCINGALLFDDNGNVVADHRIPANLALAVYKIAKIMDVEMLGVFGKYWATNSHEGYLYSKKRPIYMCDSLIVDFNDFLLKQEMNKLLFMSKNKSTLLELESKIKDAFGSELTYYPGTDFLEIMPKGINKGTAVIDLSKHYNIPLSDIMVLGDDINDIEMLKVAGLSVVMDNASEEIKKLGNYITSDNNSDGVAKALMHFWREM